jgi:hypothetical protein
MTRPTFRRAAATGVVLGLLVPAVAAQQQVTEDPDIARIRMQVKDFEMALRNAAEAGGAALANDVSTRFPGATIAWSSEPVVRGWYQPHFGFAFVVEVPGILPVTLIGLRTRPPGLQSQTGLPTNVPRSGDASPVSPPPPPWEPERAYGDHVRSALIESLLESSKGLPVKATDWIALTAMSSPAPYPALEPRRKTLTLQIRGADLGAYHRGEIARDEAIKRIVESRF